jgi:hypothetical protein
MKVHPTQKKCEQVDLGRVIGRFVKKAVGIWSQRIRIRGQVSRNSHHLALSGLHFAGLISLAVLLVGASAGCTTSEPSAVAPALPTTAATDQATQAPTPKPAQPGGKPTLYLPPTPAPGTTLNLPPSATASLTALAQSFSPTITPECSNDLKFLEDLTIPDGTVIAPGAQIDKRWQVQNSGTCNWDARYSLRLVDGLSLGAPEEQALFPARGGAQALIRMLFTAPAEAGSYQSAWKAFDPEGVEFGEAIYIQIVVRVTSTPST